MTQQLGTAGTLSNGQCGIDVGASSVSGAGNTLTLKLVVTRTPAFTGAKTIYGYAAETAT